MQTITIEPTEEFPITCNEANVRMMVDGIINDPSSWNMHYYALRSDCGTTYCAAGLTVIQHGYEIVYKSSALTRVTTVTCSNPVTNAYGNISDVAQELLDLTDEQADDLFMFYENERHPTIIEFVQQVADVTGITFKNLSV